MPYAAMKILVLDNYDSFTYNLVQYVQELLGQEVAVFRNDAIALDEVAAYDGIILSPGPGLPAEAGIMPALIERYAPTKHILGVCLGHQAIGEAFGAGLRNLQQVYHGMETPIFHPNEAGDVLLEGLPSPFNAGRYHSWVVDEQNFPQALKITARDAEGEIMAMRHRKFGVFGVQFHPESIMTAEGKPLLNNFLMHCRSALRASVGQ
jgi:anthranilate synthase component 2